MLESGCLLNEVIPGQTAVLHTPLQWFIFSTFYRKRHYNVYSCICLPACLPAPRMWALWCPTPRKAAVNEKIINIFGKINSPSLTLLTTQHLYNCLYFFLMRNLIVKVSQHESGRTVIWISAILAARYFGLILLHAFAWIRSGRKKGVSSKRMFTIFHRFIISIINDVY